MGSNIRTRAKSIDEYISLYAENVQKVLKKMRATIRESAPAAEEAISYQIPTFKLHGNLVHFAAFKNHIGFYPTSSGILHFKKELSGYKLSRGTAQFPLDKPIPYDLIQKIVIFRVKENMKKSKHFADRATRTLTSESNNSRN
jgi:uncharacterized protein YdhG (YjbR/CyaY superfamily)